MSEYYAQSVSREDMRQIAYLVRKKFGYLNRWNLPVDRLLDQMCDAFPELSYEIVPDNEWDDPTAHAVTTITEHTIRIRESIYSRACEGKGRDRMTIAHEIAHYILICVTEVKLYCRGDKNVETYNDPEWQTKCLAAELLIPYYKLKAYKKKPSVSFISNICGVSSDAAEYQLQFI